MSAKYKLVLRKDFSKDAPEGSTKLYAQLVNNGTVGFEELCESIAEETTLTSADVKSCLDRLPRHIARHVKEGRTVQAGELGTFRPVVGSKGAATEKEFDAATMMKRPSISFIPGKTIQAVRNSMTFTRVKKDDESSKEEGGNDRPEIE
ncbi:HU family DNA-binding protein [Parabacteroides goldsteinii]|uniref:HU family DNA-binding protein n=1 Tax=Parabacteroides goldsteinii TaxID=328812 RepID=UPI003AB55B73